jgi:hypothetical protein
MLPILTATLVLASTGVSQSPPALACNTKAIAESDRPRYKALVEKLGRAIREKRELPNGYSLVLEERAISLAETGEWISFERKCCPFLSMRMEVTGGGPGITLSLTGPEGVKAVLQAAFAP